jgi:hypothetical protein
LLLQTAESAADFERFNAGSNIAARIAMMAITTNSSMSVKAKRVVKLAAAPGLPIGRKFLPSAFMQVPLLGW